MGALLPDMGGCSQLGPPRAWSRKKNQLFLQTAFDISFHGLLAAASSSQLKPSPQKSLAFSHEATAEELAKFPSERERAIRRAARAATSSAVSAKAP